MKSRIIDALVAISNGENTALKNKLISEIGDKKLQINAEKVLRNILHDYSAFSVSTIDSFFQRILRALSREIHLPLNPEVQVEIDDAIMDATENLLREIGTDPDLTQWLTQLALQKMEDEKGWNLEYDIITVAKELFKENRQDTLTLTREQIHTHYNKLQAFKKSFERKISELGEKGVKIIRKNNLAIDDFFYGKTGVAAYFSKIIAFTDYETLKIKGRTAEALSSGEKWVKKTSPLRDEIITLAEKELIPLLRSISDYLEENLRQYATASEILKKLYLFGIVNDLKRKLSEYRTENNVILLADTTRLLSDVIHDNDAPFIYEKTGNRYKHLLIDEFQDTSKLQWKNILPLIINSLGSGHTTMLVGDAKQSIYRWRGGNMNLLLKDLYSDLGSFMELKMEEILSMNFRSKKEIIDFNNAFFSSASTLAEEQLEMNEFKLLKLAYNKEIKQEIAEKNTTGGYVSIKFLNNNKSETDSAGWKAEAMERTFDSISELLQKKYSYRDICVLVRNNDEGNDLANFLFTKGIKNFISPDSLLIEASPKIQFILNIFRFLSDNLNTIARSEIIYYYKRYLSESTAEEWHEVFSDHKFAKTKRKPEPNALFEGLEENLFNKILPEKFTRELSRLSRLPVFELSEQIVAIFGLNKKPDAYIQRFQDLIIEFAVRTGSSLESFLHWWENSNAVKKASVIIPESTDAIRIMTIHKAKGLQFPVVIMPFAEWQLTPKANEIIWMDATNSPYHELGTVAVTSSSKLKETFFSEEYLEEIHHTFIDNLNLLYVAFTRAEEKLFVFTKQDNETDLNSVSKLLFRTLRLLDSGLADHFIAGENHDKIKSDQDTSRFHNEVLKSYPVSVRKDKLVLKSRSVDLISVLENQKITKSGYGIIVHNILAAIQSKSEARQVTEKFMFEGLITEEDKQHILEEINQLFEIPEFAEYFDNRNIIMSERDIILPDGEVLRPDRVIIRNNEVKVIDFKTGKRDVSHADQVLRYAEQLENMGYSNIVCEIVYLQEKQIVKLATEKKSS